MGNGKWKFDPNYSSKHIIWGWLQIEKILKVDTLDKEKYKWANYHPHFYKGTNDSNTLYLGKKKLDIPSLKDKGIDGAGVFENFSINRQLTADEFKLTRWKLPKWIYPQNDISKLSYHNDLNRWQEQENHTLLQTVSRGQEFVLNCDNYSIEAEQWVANLFS
ncbi:MAG: hypothetical protein COW71_11090 [Ignavibacteriales bacterium CG18_big_fil_WC_8_21_14_2_50_31_20]|nr:MAG: hypothetical protein COW71_11090 [Ignavibacteriales bacterium CG18_big_fil_WC_8_21_14_2_50_31_20]